MSIRHHIAQALIGPGHQILPRDFPAQRLDKLRASIMSAWESSLVWGGGNYLEQVFIPQYVGLVDVASAAERLYLDPSDAEARARLRRELDDYLEDLDTAKAMRGVYGRAAMERIDRIHRLERVIARVKAVPADHDCGDPRSRADLETALGQLREAIDSAEQVSA